ncbi:MAG: hypothetical protein GC179_05805 [Anaerolineaceae bacterium]|nr:hypothetical protein [Anaerolineaceae bacterium]
MAGGGITGAIRGTCVISAASAEPAASQNCPFSALLPHIRQSIQRIVLAECQVPILGCGMGINR